MKLLYIATNLNTSGGVSRVLSVKTNYLVENFKYETHVINTNGNVDDLFYAFNDNVHLHSLDKTSSELSRIFNYRKLLNEKIKIINPDVIINCDNGLKGVLLPLLIKEKAPIIYENHKSENAKADTLFENLKLQLSFLFFSLTSNIYKWVVVFELSEKNRRLSNIKVISNPLGFEKPDQIAELKNKTAIAVGRFSHEKGYVRLMEIWSLVVKKQPEWVLNIYGEGDFTNLELVTKKLNIQNKVNFFEPTIDIESIYINASLLLSTSRYESFGLVLIEAMACGLPVFTFKSAIGPNIYIKNKQNGFLLETDNIEDYANEIINLLNNRTEMLRIGAAAQENVSVFEIKNIMKQWHQLFESVV